MKPDFEHLEEPHDFIDDFLSLFRIGKEGS